MIGDGFVALSMVFNVKDPLLVLRGYLEHVKKGYCRIYGREQVSQRALNHSLETIVAG